MNPVLFYLFAAITLIFGGLVVVLRNPVASALSLVVSFVGLAALFLGLDAYFIAIIQILVYAGAVMVLFLFIIMLLDIKHEGLQKQGIASVVGGGLVALIFACQLGVVISRTEITAKGTEDVPIKYEIAAAQQSLPGTKADLLAHTLPDAKLVGAMVYHKYPMQLQLMGVLLLVGTVGVVIMSKRQIQ